MPVEIATAYVSLVPSARGFGRALFGELAGELAGPNRAIDDLDGSLNRSASASKVLAGALAAIGAGAVLRGLYQAASAASDLVESQSKATQVFGSSTGAVREFASTAATSVGLSERVATEATATFGNLFTAMGIGRQAAAGMSTQMVELGADLASFNNIPVDVALEKIRSGLVGEIEPLRELGISFNAAQVEAKALELGLAGANGEVSESAKVQARLALITEQSSNAAGDFARTSDGLANQQRILRAEFDNAVVSLGQQMLPLLLDLVAVARESLPAFTDLGVATGRILVEGLRAVIPLMGTTTDLLVAVEPAVSAVATVIEALPDPLVQTTALLYAASRAMNDTAASATLLGGSLGTAGAAGLSKVVSRGAPLLIGLTLFKSGLDAIFGPNGAAPSPREVQELSGSLADLGRTAQTTGVLANLVGEDWGKLRDAFDELDDPGLLEQARHGVDQFADTVTLGLLDTETNTEKARSRFAELDTALAQLASSQPEVALEAVDIAAQRLGVSSSELRDRLPETDTALRAVARSAREETAAALAEVNAELLEVLSHAPAIASAMTAIQTPGGDLTAEFNLLATAIGAADLSAEQMAAIASTLGVDLDTLTGHVTAVQEVVTDLQSAAEGAVPGIDDIASQVDDLAELTAPELSDTLRGMYDQLTSFNENVRLVFEQRPLLAPLAAQSPEIAALIGGAIRDGKVDALAEWELLVSGIGQQEQATVDLINQFSPEVVAALQAQGLLSTNALEQSFHPEIPTRLRQADALAAINASREPIVGAATDVGTGASSGFDAALSSIGGFVTTRMEQARAGIVLSRGVLYGAGSYSGSGASEGLLVGMDTPADSIDAVIQRTRTRIFNSVERLFGIASPARVMIPYGQKITEGLVEGIVNNDSFLDRMLGAFGLNLQAKLGANLPGGKGLVGFAAVAHRVFQSMFPWMTIGGWRPTGSVPGSDHPKGKALDLMTSSGAIANQIISAFLGMAGAKYWIWNRRIATAAGNWVPRPYSGPSPHTDHVHLSFFEKGGVADYTGLHFLHEGEGVLSVDQMRFLARASSGVGLGGPATVIGPVNVYANTPEEARASGRVFLQTLAERRVLVDARIA